MTLKVNTIIEIVGKPKDHVIETMDKVVSLIKNSDKFKYVSHSREEPKSIPQSEKIFSTFSEFEINFPSIAALSGFCFDFMPSSVEIIEPEELKVKSEDITDTLNDLIAKLHQYDMTLKGYILKEKAEQSKKSN